MERRSSSWPRTLEYLRSGCWLDFDGSFLGERTCEIWVKWGTAAYRSASAL